MSLEIYCANPACKRRHRVPTGAAGQTVKCRACGETFIAAGPPPSTPPASDATRSAKSPSSVSTPAAPRAAQSDDFIQPAWDSATTQRSSPSLAPGISAVGRFVIRGKVGAGAFGTVYRAYDPQLDRVVALKVPNPGVMDTPKRVERFLREAKAAAGLRHPHIVPVFDAGQDGDRYYIATAFIDGKPLSEAIPETGMEFNRAVKLARELAEALAYAHEQGIVHRDVKPQNVMLDKHDRVHLMDFGLAARQEVEARLTTDGAVMGTPSYMAPEQAKGQTGEVQPATDQYAVGVVLYELLTGRTPFVGPTPVVLHNVIHTEPEPPRTHRADVPRDLETVCLKALAKRPEDRYAGCQELADDLRRWQEGEPVSARPLRAWERLSRWVRKEPKLALAGALVAAVIVASFVLISDAASRADAARREAEESLAQARENAARREAAEKRERDALEKTSGAIGTAIEERKRGDDFKAQAEASQAQLAQERRQADEVRAQLRAKGVAPEELFQIAFRVYWGGLVDEARTLLQFIPEERRDWEWRYLSRLCDLPKAEPRSVVLKRPDGTLYVANFNRDSTRAVIASNDNTARVCDARTGTEVFALKGHSGSVYWAAFSPDGERVVTASADKTARVWDAKSGAELFTLKGHSGSIYSVNFSSDGTRIVTASADGTVRVWDAAGKELVALEGHAGSVHFACFSPDGSLVATAGGDRTARLWDAKSGKEVLRLTGHSNTVYSVAFHPEDARVVTASNDGTARVWDAATGKELLVLKHGGGVLSAAFSPDGTRIATASADETARVWDAGTGKEVLRFKYAAGAYAVAWSADGSKLAVALANRTAEVYDGPSPAAGPKSPDLKPAEVTPPAPSPKIDPKKLVGKWKLSTSKAGSTNEFTADGKYIVTIGSFKSERTYTLEGDKLTIDAKTKDGSVPQYTITKLTDDELVMRDKNGKEIMRTRIKP
jgi:uncharacterized protein (TIGR03066 family)